MYITTWDASILKTTQPPKQKTNLQQHTQQLTLHHKHHTYLTTLNKLTTFGRNHITLTSIKP